MSKVCIVLNTKFHYESLYNLISICRRIRRNVTVWSHPTFFSWYGLQSVLDKAGVDTTTDLAVLEQPDTQFIVVSAAIRDFSLPEGPPEVKEMHRRLQKKKCVWVCHNLKPCRWKTVPERRVFLTPLANVRFSAPFLHQVEGLLPVAPTSTNCIAVVGKFTYEHTSQSNTLWEAIQRACAATGKRVCLLGEFGTAKSATRLATIMGILGQHAEACLNLPEEAFYHKLGSCAAILAVGAPNDAETSAYFQYKMSGAYGMAVQLGKPLIAHPLVRVLHGIPVIPYRDAGELELVIANYDAMTPRYLDIQAQARVHMMEHNASTLSQLLIMDAPTPKGLQIDVVYRAPARNDTAVIIAFFNFVNYERPVKNLAHILKLLEAAKIPVFLGHGRLPEQPPLRVSYGTVREYVTRTPFFAKERLMNLVEAHVPDEYTKLVFLDGDVIFQNQDWINSMSLALDTHQIVQGYERVGNLDHLHTGMCTAWRLSAASQVKPSVNMHSDSEPYGIGFCWGMRRDTFRALGGLYDRCITGGGDAVLFLSAFGQKHENSRLCLFRDKNFACSGQRADIQDYLAHAETLSLTSGFLSDDILHMWHGSRLNRQYESRHEHLSKLETLPLFIRLDGLYEVTDQAVVDGIVQYLTDRDDDHPSAQEILA